jgi:hypothetical protein
VPPVVLRALTVDPRQPEAGKLMATTVVAVKQGKRLRAGRVRCHGRIDGRRVEVVVHEFRRGKATCVWQLPESASGKLVNAVVVVQLGRARAKAPFKAQVG